MKKIFLIGLAATAMLASCSNDETVEMAQNTKAIGFSSFIDKSTRATDTDITNLGAIEVYGWRDDAQIFNAKAVTVDATGNGTYSPLQYWEPGYTYAFEAIAPKSGENGVTFAAAKDGGTITFVSDSETDLLYSKAADKKTDAKVTADPGKVGFTFKHLLSRVKFTFKNTFPANAAAKISVKDVKITNAYQNGTITPAEENAVWNATNNTLSVVFASDNVKDLVAGTGSGETKHMYLIPVASPQYTVTFTVVLDQNGATTEYPHTSTITTRMEKGKSYNFVAALNETNVTPDELFPIEFTAEVDPWGAFTNNDITVE
uniref:fimbrillin family protein n=1 Tax=Candidatus Limisoma sp. TaxID=3076476 RepID=UPI003FEEFB31